MTPTILSLWHESADHSSIRSSTIADTSQLVQIQSLYSLISSGTEKLVASKQVPIDLHQSMKVPYMEGSFQLPIKYGYSLVGIINHNNHPNNGALVHLLHPHQNNCFVKETDLSLIPNGIPPKRAILASNMETALNAVWDAGISIGDKALVLGFGLVGSLIARLLQMLPAVDVFIHDINENRINIAKDLGFKIYDGTDASFFDYAFHTSGSSGGLQTCIDSIGKEGKVIELSWYGNKTTEIKLGGTFHSLRKQIISSQVSYLPANKSARWDYSRRKAVVYDLLKNPIFDQHITDLIEFQKAPAFFQDLRMNKVEGLAWGIRY